MPFEYERAEVMPCGCRILGRLPEYRILLRPCSLAHGAVVREALAEAAALPPLVLLPELSQPDDRGQ
jgi:hypothetical protein